MAERQLGPQKGPKGEKIHGQSKHSRSSKISRRARSDGRRHRSRGRRPGCRAATGQGGRRTAQRQDSRHPVQDRPHDLPHRPGRGARRAVVEGSHPGGGGDHAQGGFLGKRKIETVTADEAAGTDGNVKELRRMKLEGKIDLFTGVISSGNTPALGPVAEELSLLTIFVDGCTDFLFDKAVPQPKYTFRITNIQSADGITSAIGTAQAWPQVRRIAHIHPDYSYGRNAAEHYTLALERLLPGTEVVSESWPKLGTTDFTSHITKAMSANPDILYTSVWGGDYIALYKQALRYGLFDKMKVATTLALGVAPHA